MSADSPAPMQPTPRIEIASTLDEATLGDVLELIDAATAIEGHRPVGEHKHSHLRVGARHWVGILAYDTSHLLVGYAHTRWNRPGDQPRMAVEVVVHPDWYGSDVAERLLQATRGVLAGAGGGLLYLWVHRVEDPRETLAYKMGFAVQRELAFMERDLPERPQRPVLPEGVEVRGYRQGPDDDALLAVNNAAFADHPENGDWDAAKLAERQDRDWFDPEGVFIAWRGDEPLAFHWTKWHAHDSDEHPAHEPVGEVYILGVHPRAQGLGLGRAMLRIGLAHLHDRGCRRAMLYVDCANTGAVALYESEGFAIAYREVCYEERVEAEVTNRPADLLRPGF